MSPPWVTYLAILGTLSSICSGQVFEFRTSNYQVAFEGQALPLVLEIIRTGPTNTFANVTLEAYEVTDQYRRQWDVPVTFFPGESVRTLPFGVIDDTIDEPNRMYIFNLTNPTAGYTVGARVRTVVSYVDNDGSPLFDCKSDGCQNGARCIPETGYCDCTTANIPSGLADCRLPLSDVTGVNCNGVSCGTGVCATNAAGVTRCVCQAGYTGPNCQLNQRYNVQCFADRMCLNADPPANYNGDRYIKEKGQYSECYMQPVTDTAIAVNNLPAGWTGSYICLPNTHNVCGNAVLTTEADGTFTRSREVRIKQTAVRLASDILFTGYCKFDSRGVLYIEKGNIDSGSPLIPINATDYVTAAAVFIVDRLTGNPITFTTVNVGQEVCFAFVLQEGYSSFRLDNVIANDTLVGGEQFTVLQNGCPPQKEVNVVSRLPFLPVSNDAGRMYFCIGAFSFDNSNSVSFRFELSICTNDNTPCSPVNCAGEVSRGRKKRQTATESVMINAVINVQDPDEGERNEALTSVQLPDCELSSPIIAALSVLGVLSAVMLFATILLLVRCTKSPEKYVE